MIYNCRICGNAADYDQGHGCALATPENERHRLTLKERDEARRLVEEAKGKLNDARDTLADLLTASDQMRTERDRLKVEHQLALQEKVWIGEECDRLKVELAEARRLIESCALLPCARLSAPGTAETRGSQCGTCGSCTARRRAGQPQTRVGLFSPVQLGAPWCRHCGTHLNRHRSESPDWLYCPTDAGKEAAMPAEQAQPRYFCDAHDECANHPGPHDNQHRAEQAQGEAAPKPRTVDAETRRRRK